MSMTSTNLIDHFIRYSKAFETLDPVAILPFYHEPCLLISPQGVVLMPTRTEVASTFRDLMSNLRSQGYRRSEFEELNATALSPHLALLTGVGIWRRTDGSELRRFGLTYTFLSAGAAWEIVVATVHDPDAWAMEP